MHNRAASARLNVLVADAWLDRLSEVVKRLESAGMRVTEVIASIGAVTGSAPTDRIDSLARVSGVEAVERERVYQLPDRDSDVQ
jgi:hypothetical protein